MEYQSVEVGLRLPGARVKEERTAHGHRSLFRQWDLDSGAVTQAHTLKAEFHGIGNKPQWSCYFKKQGKEWKDTVGVHNEPPPGCASVVRRLLGAEGNFSFRGSLCPCPEAPRKLWMRGLAHRTLPEVTTSDPSTGKGTLPFTRSLLFFLSCDYLLNPHKAPDLNLSSGCPILYLTPLSVSEPLVQVGSLTLSCTWSSCAHKIKFYFLVSVHLLLIFEPAKRNSREGRIRPFPTIHKWFPIMPYLSKYFYLC